VTRIDIDIDWFMDCQTLTKLRGECANCLLSILRSPSQIIILLSLKLKFIDSTSDGKKIREIGVSRLLLELSFHFSASPHKPEISRFQREVSLLEATAMFSNFNSVSIFVFLSIPVPPTLEYSVR
jgi:hypothetical protein